jgi:hypothetical protein
MDATRDHYVKLSIPGSGQRLHVFPHMWTLNPKDKCRHKYVHSHIHTCIHMEHVCNNGIV